MTDLDFSGLSPVDLEQVLDGPDLLPPHGTTSDFIHPPNQNGVGLAGLVVCLTISTIFLFIRVYVEFFKLKKPHVVECKHD